MSLRSCSTVLAAAAALLGATACVDIVGSDIRNQYVERDEKHFSISGMPDVSLSTFDGAIEVRTWDKADVQVIVEKRGADKASVADIEVRAEQSGNRVSVEVKPPKSRGFNFTFGVSRSATLIVSVPASSNLLARSGDGSIEVEGLRGRIELRSGDGSIRARDVTGDLNVQTGDGSITLNGKLGGLHARSGDGSVKVSAASGSMPSGDWDITTGDGSVTLELPDGFNGELDAHTGDGSVRLDDLQLSNVTGEIGKRTVRGRLGNGGSLVRVRTGDGSITLRRF